jgi:glycine cleavage system aminomethyltransferase T
VTEQLIEPGPAPRGAPEPPAEDPILRSPLGAANAGLGADFVLEAGWELPRSYGDPEKERRLLTGSVSLADVTPRGKIDVRGPLQAALPAGRDDLVARIADDWALVLCPPGPVGERVASLQERLGSAGMATDATHLYAGLALCGPGLPDLLARLTSWDPTTLAPGSAAGAPLAEVRAVVVRRQASFPLIEAYVPTESARYVFEAALGVVARLGGGPVGWDALRAEGWR